jgi:hypothetical protein
VVTEKLANVSPLVRKNVYGFKYLSQLGADFASSTVLGIHKLRNFEEVQKINLREFRNRGRLLLPCFCLAEPFK